MKEGKILYGELKELTEANEKYKRLVYAIIDEVEKFIAEKNAKKSYYPKRSDQYQLKVTVPAIPITGQEKEVIENWLEENYLSQLYGDTIWLRKCYFKKKYKVTSGCYEM